MYVKITIVYRKEKLPRDEEHYIGEFIHPLQSEAWMKEFRILDVGSEFTLENANQRPAHHPLYRPESSDPRTMYGYLYRRLRESEQQSALQ